MNITDRVNRPVAVRDGRTTNERHVIDAAEDRPGECIFVENDREPYDEDIDIAAADIVDSEPGIR